MLDLHLLQGPGGPYDAGEPEEPEAHTCRICQRESTSILVDGQICADWNCHVAAGTAAATDEERATAWRRIIREAVMRERRAYSPMNLRLIIQDCKNELAKVACPNVKRAAAAETAGWYEKLWYEENRMIGAWK